MNTPSFGAIKSPSDYRDIPLAAIGAVTLPMTFKTDISKLLVWNQQKIGSCVAHAFAKAMQVWWYKKHGEIVAFSPRFLFTLAKAQDRLPGDVGTYPRLVASIAKNTGCCTEATLPNDCSLTFAQYTDLTKLTPAAYTEAAKYKIPAYVFAETAYEIRQAIYKYGAVAILLQIGQEWWTPSWDKKDIDPLRIPTVVISGHEIVGFGWEGDFDDILNSWSAAWADNGTNKYDVAAWTPFVGEAIAIADVSPDILDTVHNLQTKQTFKHTFTVQLNTGAKGAEVTALQTALMIDGEFDSALYASLLSTKELGYFKPSGSTQTALIAFQKKYGIAPYPRVGPQTMAKLNALFSH